MKYGQVAENRSINEVIYRCFDLLSEQDQRKFVKKFREQPHDGDQIMHTLRELLVGAYIAGQGCCPEYEKKIENRTPDWFVSAQNGLAFIVEVYNFHPSQQTEKAIDEAIPPSEPYGIYAGWVGSHSERLYPALQMKAADYKDLVARRGIGFIIAVFGTFKSCLDVEETHECMSGEAGLFALYPELSGLLFFEESGCLPGSLEYRFTYLHNPHARVSLAIRDGGIPINLVAPC